MSIQLGPKQREWLAALRSGQYKQTKGQLSRENSFCCLGVLCVISGEPWNTYYFPPESIAKSFGLRCENPGPIGRDCGSLNDDGKTFAEIADILEANPQDYFKESR